MAGDRIETGIRQYVREALQRGDSPTREGAIFQLTGELGVLPSTVAKTMAAMIEAGTVTHLSGDRILVRD